MEKIELNIVKTPLDPHGRECSGGELLCSPLWTGKVMLVGFLLHEGRIVLGPRFEAFLKSVSCSSVPTLMFPQKQECEIKWTHYTVLFHVDSSIPQKITKKKQQHLFFFKEKKSNLLYISWNSFFFLNLVFHSEQLSVIYNIICDCSNTCEWLLKKIHRLRWFLV